MIQVLVQTGTGDAQKVLDITEAVSRVSYRSTRVIAPVSCEISLMPHEALDAIDMGNVVKIKDGDTVLHNGYVFRRRKKPDGLTLTCYDQLRYLRNEDVIAVENKTVTEIAQLYVDRFGLHAGEMADTGFAIPSIIETKKEILDIINDGLKDTVAATGQLYTMYDDDAKLRLVNLKDMFLPYTLTSDTSALDYSLSVSIDSNVYNQFKVVRQNPDDGVFETFVARDGDKIARWGLLQMVHEVDKEYTEDMINSVLDALAGLYGDPVVTMDLKTIGLRGLRGGNSVHVDLPGVIDAGWYLVDEVKHSYGDSGHIVDLRLLGVG